MATCTSEDSYSDAVPPPLLRCIDAVLWFDQDPPLPVSKTFLMLQSPVLYQILSSSVRFDTTADGLVKIPLPGDSRAAWLLALQLLLPPPTATTTTAPPAGPTSGGSSGEVGTD